MIQERDTFERVPSVCQKRSRLLLVKSRDLLRPSHPLLRYRI